jgi:hypothetical protein
MRIRRHDRLRTVTLEIRPPTRCRQKKAELPECEVVVLQEQGIPEDISRVITVSGGPLEPDGSAIQTTWSWRW